MATQIKADLFGVDVRTDGPVECLGINFPSDAARRTYFLEKLRERLKDPAFRNIEGFPIGEDEDILALSDPPYYTACPNPFLPEFIAEKSKHSPTEEHYDTPPYAADITEGKQDPICMAHTYHTKVPYRAIARYILHYTKPGDIVLDSFSGTGMTGVAAQFLEQPDQSFIQSVEQERRAAGRPAPNWGARNAILFDLAPFATFLSRCYNSSLGVDKFEQSAKELLQASENSLNWVYEVPAESSSTQMNYALWSDEPSKGVRWDRISTLSHG